MGQETFAVDSRYEARKCIRQCDALGEGAALHIRLLYGAYGKPQDEFLPDVY